MCIYYKAFRPKGFLINYIIMYKEYYENKCCIVTGGTGFIGRNIVEELLKFNIKSIIIFDRTLKYRWDDDRIIYIQGNLLYDLEKLCIYDFDIVFHEAANVDTTCTDNNNMINTNYNAFKNLVKICEDKGAKLIYASSAAIYGNSSAPNIVGNGENPLNIYGQSKYLMDKYIRENDIKIPVIGIRYFNVYGPGELHKNKMMSMISQIILKVKENNNVELFEFGEQKRDFVYVKDVAWCNILCGVYDKTDIFNCGYGISISFNTIFNIIKSIYKTESIIKYIPLRYDFYQNNTIADISKIQNSIGYIPKYNIEQGIHDYTKTF